MPCAMAARKHVIDHVTAQKALMRRNADAKANQLNPKLATKSAAKTVSI